MTVGSFQWGDFTHAEASRLLALLAMEVVPHFVDTPVQARARTKVAASAWVKRYYWRIEARLPSPPT